MNRFLLISLTLCACSKEPTTEAERARQNLEKAIRASGGTTYLVGDSGQQTSAERNAQISRELDQKLTPEQKAELVQIYRNYYK